MARLLFSRPAQLAAVILFIAGSPSLAATLTVQLNPTTVTAGQPATLTLTVENGEVASVGLPAVDGLLFSPGASLVTYAFTGGALLTTSVRKYQVMASRGGDFTLPAFAVSLKDGSTLYAQEVKLHADAAPTTEPAASATPSPSAGTAVSPPPDGNGTSASVTNATPSFSVPHDTDGSPARVFMLIRPLTTDAYVDQMIPIRIDFFIREDANADQDSLPTIDGSNFLMNDFTVRGHASLITLEDAPYECDTFLSAFTAPKSGDFPLAVVRDTYWVKSVATSGLDPLGFTRSTNLAHANISSNQLTMHIRPLPEEGRPANFTGAVGQFQVGNDAQPAVVAMGDPVLLTFGIRGIGNFDYVHCPTLDRDPHWKVYAPKSSITYTDEERTQGAKTFEQSALPQENGNVPLPPASFSYFDPIRRQYVTVPINLPTIAVTGAMPLPNAAPAVTGDLAPSPLRGDDFAPNRTELGELQANLFPVARTSWFWPVQGACAAFPLLGLLIFFLRRWRSVGQKDPRLIARRHTLRQEEAAMAQAERQGDVRAFFLAARHALQLHLSAAWNIAAESITLGEIRRRDPALAQSLGPFFAQADAVLYSGRLTSGPDLAHWARIAREHLHAQTVS